MNSTEAPAEVPKEAWAAHSASYLRWACERLIDQRRALWEEGLSVQKRAFMAVAVQWGVTAFFVEPLRSAPVGVQLFVTLALLVSGAAMFPTIWVRGSWEMSPRIYWDDKLRDFQEIGVLLTAATEHRDAVLRRIRVVDRRGKWAQVAQACAAVGVVSMLILAVLLGASGDGPRERSEATSYPAGTSAPAPGAGSPR